VKTFILQKINSLSETELWLLKTKLESEEGLKTDFDNAIEATRKLKDLLFHICSVKTFHEKSIAERITNMGL
jgi:hypothetical protein